LKALRIMLGTGVRELLSGMPDDAILVASWLILPAICIGCMRQMIAAQRITLDFSLRRLESIELDRAIVLYARVCNDLEEIGRRGADCNGSLRSRYRHRAEIRRQYGKEIEDLTTYAHHLRGMIIRIRRKPLQRYRSWVHAVSSRFAFSYALAVYLLILTVLLAYLSEQRVWAAELTIKTETMLIWNAIREPLLYANVFSAGFVAILMPIFYFARRTALFIEERAQSQLLKEFARTDPDRLISREQDSKADQYPPEEQGPEEPPPDRSWFSVLGVSPSATIDEIKEAYKVKIKQNHPDRVCGMSPVFTELAEAESKKLNAAYQEGLDIVSLSPALASHAHSS
jgi:hypothetical protein